MKALVLTAIIFFIPIRQESADSLIKDISRLRVMEGTWQGEGWIMDASGHKKRFHQTEVIKSKVNGNVLTIDGLGYAMEDSGITDRVIHDVVGIISINPESGNATIFSILENQGRSEVALYEVEGKDIFYWSFKDPRSGSTIRFTEDLSTPGQWIGKGEVLTGANRWYQFFEMVLARQS